MCVKIRNNFPPGFQLRHLYSFGLNVVKKIISGQRRRNISPNDFLFLNLVFGPACDLKCPDV